MKAKVRLIIFLLIAAGLLFCIPRPVDAQAVFTNFSGSEVFVEDLFPGKEWLAGGDNYHLRNLTSTFAVTATDERISGVNTVTINWNFKLVAPPVFATGQMWGTFVIVNGGGSWEGTWTGLRDKNGFSYFQYIGAGRGNYAGMRMRMDAERLTPDGSEPETLTGTILETNH